MSTWLTALTVAWLMQAASSFMIRATPVLGPALIEAAHLDAQAIGYFAAATAAGTVWLLGGCSPLLRRMGPLRLLQAGALVGAAGLILTASLWWPAMLAGAFLIGVGYGPSPPAGSDILSRYSPKAHLGLIFSIKQSAVPVGGVVAGLTIPAALLGVGLTGTLMLSAAAVALLGLAMQPWRWMVDREREPRSAVGWRPFLSTDLVTTPIRNITKIPGLATITFAGFAFAIVQGVLIGFLVTFLVNGLSYRLTLAGLAFAIMQATGTIGRIVMGWLADRLQSNRRILLVLAAGACVTMIAFALMKDNWPQAVILTVGGLSGVAAVSWNGVCLAEIARLSPEGRVAEMTAAATMFIFVGYAVGPAAFSALLGLTGNYAAGFGATALLPLAALIVLLPARKTTA